MDPTEFCKVQISIWIEFRFHDLSVLILKISHNVLGISEGRAIEAHALVYVQKFNVSGCPFLCFDLFQILSKKFFQFVKRNYIYFIIQIYVYSIWNYH